MTPGQFWHDQAPVLASLVVAWHLPTPSVIGTALRASWAIKKGFPMPSPNPIALVGAALKLGDDGLKLVKDIKAHDKPDAIAATLDALPALATVSGVAVEDLQAVVTAETLGLVWDLEQDIEGIVPMVKAAVAKFKGT